MAKLKGKDIMVFAEGKAVAVAKDCTIKIDYDLIEVSSPTSSKAKEFIPGRYTWEVDVNGLVPVDGFSTFMLRAGRELTMSIGKVDSRNHLTTDGLRGRAICPTTMVSASLGSLAKSQLKLQGTGALIPLQFTEEVTINRAIDMSKEIQYRLEPGYDFGYPSGSPGTYTTLYYTFWDSSKFPAIPKRIIATPLTDTVYIYKGVNYVWSSADQEFVTLEEYTDI